MPQFGRTTGAPLRDQISASGRLDRITELSQAAQAGPTEGVRYSMSQFHVLFAGSALLCFAFAVSVVPHLATRLQKQLNCEKTRFDGPRTPCVSVPAPGRPLPREKPGRRGILPSANLTQAGDCHGPCPPRVLSVRQSCREGSGASKRPKVMLQYYVGLRRGGSSASRRFQHLLTRCRSLVWSVKRGHPMVCHQPYRQRLSHLCGFIDPPT